VSASGRGGDDDFRSTGGLSAEITNGLGSIEEGRSKKRGKSITE
jgi:hypothetical protein